MLLSYLELVDLVANGVINADPSHINGASIDLTLHDTILVERFNNDRQPEVDLSAKQAPEMIQLVMNPGGFALTPGQFILASTCETFNLPNDIAAEFKLKSSLARGGLNHLLAGFADPLWHNSRLTLELTNTLQYHTLRLKQGMKIGQMIFYRVKPVPHEASYAVKGRYNNTTNTTGSKGV
jgi:dCTP deaminase